MVQTALRLAALSRERARSAVTGDVIGRSCIYCNRCSSNRAASTASLRLIESGTLQEQLTLESRSRGAPLSKRMSGLVDGSVRGARFVAAYVALLLSSFFPLRRVEIVSDQLAGQVLTYPKVMSSFRWKFIVRVRRSRNCSDRYRDRTNQI